MAISNGDKISSGWWDGTGTITQLFGALEDLPQFGISAPHTGIDISMPSGTTLRTAEHATVVAAGPSSGGFGTRVILKLDDGSTVLFGHMESTAVAVGQSLNPGDIIGLSDSTGASTGPHLHFEHDLVGGQAVDPTDLLQGKFGVPALSAIGGVLQFPQAVGDFFTALTKSHDPCNPPADEPTLLKFVDFLSCSKNWWRAGFIFGGAGLILVGGLIYFLSSSDGRRAEGLAQKSIVKDI